MLILHSIFYANKTTQSPPLIYQGLLYGIMTEELVIREIRIDEAAKYLRHKMCVALYNIYAKYELPYYKKSCVVSAGYS